MCEILHRMRMVKRCLSTVIASVNQMHATSCFKDYEEAVMTLNSLQTNHALLLELKKENRTSHAVQRRKLEETAMFLVRSGISLKKLDQLSVIHVSGTKGKGSTCAFCESILRHHGFKTGFYSSPHLVAVRERIRINGRPLSQHAFATYFWEVYNSLKESMEREGDMPPYFKFLTVMAFNVFLSEKVDVAIIEVGIGGEYDCTNILRQVSTVGISSLGIDHTSLLGSTIEEIAWQKGGIMKPGSITFTVDQQPKAALEVLKQRASENKSTLLIAPPLESYDWSCFSPQLGAVASVQFLNASLAIQLANAWMQQQTSGFFTQSDSKNVVPEKIYEKTPSEMNFSIPFATTFPITSNVASGLRFCRWPGRNQIISEGFIHYFLDGAHTSESLWLCADWFMQNSRAIVKEKINAYRVLVFNCTGDRDPKALLLPLLNCEFQLIIFCPNSVTTNTNCSSDQANFMISMTQQLNQCKRSEKAWHELQKEIVKANFNSPNDLLQPIHVPNNVPKSIIDSRDPFKPKAEVKLLPCVSDTLAYLKKKAENEAQEYHIFVTGSLHLVGTVLSVLDPELTLTTCQLSGDIGVSATKSSNIMDNYGIY